MQGQAHLKDLEAGDVQHPDEELPLHLDVQGLIDTDHLPLEHLFIGGLDQGPMVLLRRSVFWPFCPDALPALTRGLVMPFWSFLELRPMRWATLPVTQ